MVGVLKNTLTSHPNRKPSQIDLIKRDKVDQMSWAPQGSCVEAHAGSRLLLLARRAHGQWQGHGHEQLKGHTDKGSGHATRTCFLFRGKVEIIVPAFGRTEKHSVWLRCSSLCQNTEALSTLAGQWRKLRQWNPLSVLNHCNRQGFTIPNIPISITTQNKQLPVSTV